MTDTAGNSIEPSPVESMEDANTTLEQTAMPEQSNNMLAATTSLDSNADMQQQQQTNESLLMNNNNDMVDSLVDVPSNLNMNNNNNNSMSMNNSMEGGLDVESESPTRMQTNTGDAPPVELLADDAAQSRYQHKMAQEQVKQLEKTALPLALAFQKYALRIGNLRDKGDCLTQRLIQLAELCSYNTSIRSGMANCTRWLACLLDHTNVRAYRIQDNVAVPLINKFSEQFKRMQQELKTTRKALEREEKLFKQLTHTRRQRGSLDYQKAFSTYQNARRDRSESCVRLELSMNILRTNRMSDVRQALRNFCHTELHYHCKAIETLTEAYQQVKMMDVEKDQHEFRRALNIAGMMNKTSENYHHHQSYQRRNNQSSSPVQTRSGMRARLRQARSRYMMRNQQRQQPQQQQRYLNATADMQYDIQQQQYASPATAIARNNTGRTLQNQGITARTVARELHQVDTLIDQNQAKLQNLQRYEQTGNNKPYARPPFNNVRQDFVDTTTTQRNFQQQQHLQRPYAPPPRARSQSPQPHGRATSAPPPRGNTLPNRRQKPYDDDAMFDYLNQRLQVEQKRYDREWQTRNRFENEQFKSMRQLPANYQVDQQQQQNNMTTDPSLIQQHLNDAVQVRRQIIRKNRLQTHQQQQSGNNRRTPTTRETKTSFHTTDYDHGPVTIFPAPIPTEIDYSRTHDTTSFHSQDIRDARAVPVPRTQQVPNRQRRSSGGEQPQQQQQQREPIIYRNPDPPEHLNGASPVRNRSRPASAGNNATTRNTNRVVQEINNNSYYYD